MTAAVIEEKCLSFQFQFKIALSEILSTFYPAVAWQTPNWCQTYEELTDIKWNTVIEHLVSADLPQNKLKYLIASRNNDHLLAFLGTGEICNQNKKKNIYRNR